jgi:hypothetical protein
LGRQVFIGIAVTVTTNNGLVKVRVGSEVESASAGRNQIWRKAGVINSKRSPHLENIATLSKKNDTKERRVLALVLHRPLRAVLTVGMNEATPRKRFLMSV